MTKVKTIEDVARVIDDWIEEFQERTELMLRDHGATDEEVAAQLVWQMKGMQHNREKLLEKTKRLMQHGFGAPSLELQ